MLIRRGQRERQRDPAGPGAAGRQVGEVHGGRLVAKRARVGAREKVPALDEHVGGYRELRAVGDADPRAIVAYPLYGALRRAGEETTDDFKLVQTILVRDFATSSGRSAVA